MTMIDRQTREERRREQREGVEALEAPGALDDLYAMIDAGQVRPDGKDGPVQQLIKAGIGGGWPREALEKVTNIAPTTTTRSDGVPILGWGEGYSDGQRADVIQALRDHKPVATETATSAGQFDTNGKSVAHAVATPVSSLDDTVCHAPQQTDLTMYASHAYMVVDAIEDSVTLRNPWGRNFDGSSQLRV
ncbi:MAG: hypothetical protein L0K65_04430 [Actinomyces sp.]|nr:hypothetical protein [Actinomyces sp.]